MKNSVMKCFAILLLAAGGLSSIQPPKASAASPQVVINEVAWMGTTVSANDEWLELYNPTDSAVTLSGWTLNDHGGTLSIPLSGTIPSHGFYILERTDDTSLPGIQANEIYTGALTNSGADLQLKNSSGTLVDEVSQWYAGDNTTKSTMERISADQSGTDSANWKTASSKYDAGYGTPASETSSSTEHLNQVSNSDGAINVYFNKSVEANYASSGNTANSNINLANRLIDRINEAQQSIDVAVYEINLPKIINALIQKASEGVEVRLIVDAKDPSDAESVARYQLMRADLEKLVRGLDGTPGTSDDVHVYGDSAIFAVADTAIRQQYGLSADGYNDFPNKTVQVGNSSVTGHLLADGETKSDGGYYSPGNQMHNKFAIIDQKWVWTGSWNFTTTGLYGSDDNRNQGLLEGNTQNSVEINSPELAGIYRTEFDEMWGSDTNQDAPSVSNFGDRKIDNTVHTVNVNGTMIDVYFSGGDDALGHVINYINNNADLKAYFCIFAWSDQSLVDALKVKWEGSDQDLQGTLTGFDVKGVFDSAFWNQWWSASIEMTGRTASQTSTGNPNTRWKNPAPVYSDQEDRKLHDKYMLIDPDTTSDPAVITGSTNWSANGNKYNDENMLIIHNQQIANQYVQDFYARYDAARG